MEKEYVKTGFIKRVITTALVASICITNVFSLGAATAEAKTKTSPKLSKKSVTIAKGGKQTIKLKNGKGKWAIKDGGIVKVYKKTKTSITVKPVKAGRTVVICKVNGKALKCKVRVLNNKIGKAEDERFPACVLGWNTVTSVLDEGVTVSDIEYDKRKASISWSNKEYKDDNMTITTFLINAKKPGRMIATFKYLDNGKTEYKKMPMVFVKDFRGKEKVKKTEANYKKWRKKVISTMASKNMSTWEMIDAIGYLITTGEYDSKGGTTGMQLWYGGNGTCASGAKMMDDFMKDIGIRSETHFAGNDGMSRDIYGHGVPYIRDHWNTWIRLGGKRYELNCQPNQPWPWGIVKR